MTIAYQGSVDHRDSGGNSETIQPHDVQWITAASGVVHEEMNGKEFTARGGTFEMDSSGSICRLHMKMSQPRYQAVSNDSIPVIQPGPGAIARAIAGEPDGRVESRNFTP